jgi:magnesium-dependent phosphatase 1
MLNRPRWRRADVQIAYASRTDEPEWASEAMRLLRVCADNRGLDVTLEDAVDHMEVYPVRSKTEQFHRLKAKSGVPFERMLFFDNEARNVREVATLGVCCVYTPDGMTVDNWREGVALFEEHAVDNRESQGGDRSENGMRPSLRRDGSLGSLSAGNSGKKGNSGKGRIFFSP